MSFDWAFFWKNLLTPGAPFLQGLVLTIVISVLAMVGALIVGLVVALMRRSRFAPLRVVASFYIWLIRGTPLLVQLVLIYTGFAAANVFRFEDVELGGLLVKAAVQAAIVGLVVNESAYISEIIRAGLDSVPIGQSEAAEALGMSGGSAMRWIILPQALRLMVPPLGNSFNGLMKSTSILSVIGVSEMFLVSQSISAATFRTFEIFAVVAIYYLALTTVWTVVQASIEKRLNARVGIEATVSPWQRLFGGRRGAPLTPIAVPQQEL
ncbi:amino acid ABC transporter permease [Leifsonia sp. 2MCAF36]|uniref:amino acid ABC transporter permease n=1 Tax=Leifsonia sp. 2MCAF36 TaxID=3232988 RepID=UPI003F95B679